MANNPKRQAELARLKLRLLAQQSRRSRGARQQDLLAEALVAGLSAGSGRPVSQWGKEIALTLLNVLRR